MNPGLEKHFKRVCPVECTVIPPCGWFWFQAELYTVYLLFPSIADVN